MYTSKILKKELKSLLFNKKMFFMGIALLAFGFFLIIKNGDSPLQFGNQPSFVFVLFFSMSFIGQYFTQSIYLDKKYFIADVLKVSGNNLITILIKITFYTTCALLIAFIYGLCILSISHENIFTFTNIVYTFFFTLDICSFCILTSILINEETLSYYVVLFLGLIRSLGIFYLLDELKITLSIKLIVIFIIISCSLLAIAILLYIEPFKTIKKGN